MGHWSGVKYTFKLNEEHENYEKILVSMQEEIDQKHQEERKDPGESFGVSMDKKNGYLVYSSSSYKSRVSNDLSGSLIKLIENNINSNPDIYYYIEYDNGEDAGTINYLYGYAKQVGKHLSDAGYSNYDSGIYKDSSIKKFHECMNNAEVLQQVIREGEKQRFKEYFKNKAYNVHVVYKTNFDPNDCFYKNHQPDEIWLAYFLAYGTDINFRAKVNPVHEGYVNLKEMLYINDNDLNGGKWGVNLLQYLMEHGVVFKEGLDSVEANFYKYGRHGYPSTKPTKEEIEKWYQDNKAEFKNLPIFSEETITFLQEKFPATLEKLQLKLEELKIKIKQLNQGTVMENREYWSGKYIDKLEPNEIFVFGSNPEGRHGAGAAKAALSHGAKYSVSRGLCGNTYAVVTKNLTAGCVEKATGITYAKEGFKSVSPEQIRTNIDELYECAVNNPDKKFLITYQYETYPNGAPKASLNGYTSQEMLEMFVRDDIPSNIVFHDSYAPHLAKLLKPAVEAAPTYTYFFHLTSPFSNFHPAKFEYKDLTFISNEQFMMYSKAKTFKDEVIAEKIMNIHKEFEISPGVFKDEHSKNCYQVLGAFKRGEITVEQILKNKEYVEAWNTIHKKIKALGRQVSNYDDNIWNEKRVPVVYFGAKLKFSQNPHLYDKLMSTGNSIMVEASPYDKIWGTGLNAADSARVGPLNWPGQNLLGHVLTELKKYFTLELTKPNKPKM